MKLTRLRIVGFKTFVEPTDVFIEPGLTGVVGPNGCGKSNLTEALRWVMGESSHRNVRASGMDDVIFSGSASRPARSVAEVLLTLDNAAQTVPAAFNGEDGLEISRRIERQQGSTYRINGREVRARDVQLLFADAATGARSPSLVRQGQISELIGAKPQARRRVLEDAAGIGGFHARRHEAELRLRQAEDNLLRIDDVLREIGAQAEQLRRQGKQAARYRTLSAEIRRFETVRLAILLHAARADADAARERAETDGAAAARAGADQALAARNQAVAASALVPARGAEAKAAAAHRRLEEAARSLDAAERRMEERGTALRSRADELARDLLRARGGEADAAQALTGLDAEQARLREAGDALALRLGSGADQVERMARDLAAAETGLTALQAEITGATTARAAATAALDAERRNASRLEREQRQLAEQLRQLGGASTDLPLQDLRGALTAAEAATAAAEADAAGRRACVEQARDGECDARRVHGEADRRAERLDAELRTLLGLFSTEAAEGRSRAVFDDLTVESGYETALAAALGDDLDGSEDPGAPTWWRLLTGWGGPSPPEGAEPLASRVKAPPALARRLAQIGVVDPEQGPALQELLQPGQRLVSREGDLWRWDGFVVAARAPNAAARRLAERNRVADLSREAEAARADADATLMAATSTAATLRDAVADEGAAAASLADARRSEGAARRALADAAARGAERERRLAALTGALARTEAEAANAGRRLGQAEEALARLPAAAGWMEELAARTSEVTELRSREGLARAEAASCRRESEITADRLRAVDRQRAEWRTRAERAASDADEIGARLESARAEASALAAQPDEFTLQRRRLMTEIAAAEATRRNCADRLAEAEGAAAEADRAARAALAALADMRERRAAAEARAEAARMRVDDVSRQIVERLGIQPADVWTSGALSPGGDLPASAEVETRLASLRAERERLGAVNLRAQAELDEVRGKQETLAADRDDLAGAVARLKESVASLNREGRDRMLAAFATVQEHFRRLFEILFGGGWAELQLVESDDPLQAGLDISACPPGKRAQNLSLLSGGEQALTATALIFAIFLTNPSPICVLDEVDAPLDDANVERYCDLLRAMVDETDTRFLVITHNPVTMSRMDRLYGVTMAERGVSQLVSVDLDRAERMLEAG